MTARIEALAREHEQRKVQESEQRTPPISIRVRLQHAEAIEKTVEL